jgi:hypothetical protein
MVVEGRRQMALTLRVLLVAPVVVEQMQRRDLLVILHQHLLMAGTALRRWHIKETRVVLELQERVGLAVVLAITEEAAVELVVLLLLRRLMLLAMVVWLNYQQSQVLPFTTQGVAVVEQMLIGQ